MQQAVKQEVIEHYLRERRIVEEELKLVREAAGALAHGRQALDNLLARFCYILITTPAAHAFSELTGLRLPDMPAERPGGSFPETRGWTLKQRYLKLAAQLYGEVHQMETELEEERSRARKLLGEVNQDVLSFERNYDMMTITSYLRSLDPMELQRRKVLGVNFSAKECSLAAEGMCFHPLDGESLGLTEPGPAPLEPAMAMRRAKGLLTGVCKENRKEVNALWD